MLKDSENDKILTIQVHQGALNPRTFKIPLSWVHRMTGLGWALAALSLFSSLYAAREYFSERTARPELVAALENEVQELKIALEKKGTSLTPVASSPENSAAPQDPKASEQRPPEAPGTPMEGKPGVWSGLAEQIATPPPGASPPIRLEDGKLAWQGKYANFSITVLFRDPGRGSQQGHLVALGRSNDRIFSHPEGVLNVSSGSALFDPERGEYFSVSHFRSLRFRLGPFDSPEQLKEVQVFAFDLNNKLILIQTFNYGK